MHAPIAKPLACLTNLPNPLFQGGLVASTKLVPIYPQIEPDKTTGPPDRYLPISPDLVGQRSIVSRPQSFRLMTSLSISLSKARSATIFFSRLFSSFSSRSFFMSVGNIPAYFLFQLNYVAWLIPAFRQISATGVPSSPCMMMNDVCASINLGAFIAIRSSPSK